MKLYSIIISLRAMTRFKSHTAINIASLALGLTCALTILRYVHQELTVDSHYADLANTYIMLSEREGDSSPSLGCDENPNKEEGWVYPSRAPEVEEAAEFCILNQLTVEKDNQEFSLYGMAADCVFFSIARFPLLAGSNKLEGSNDIILTDEAARRLFPNVDPLGKTVKALRGEIFTVKGIVGKPECKSTFMFDIVFNYHRDDHWSYVPFKLLRLQPGTDIDDFNERNGQFFYSKIWQYNLRYQLFPMKELYFHPSYGLRMDEQTCKGNASNVRILSIAAAILLFIGIFNFVNVYTAILLRRGKEMNIRRIYGATRSHIFACLFVENLVQVAAGLFLAWMFIDASQPLMERYLGIPQMDYKTFDWQASLALLVGLPFVTTLYPFWKHVHKAPITSMQSVGAMSRPGVSRDVFLFLQYIITSTLAVFAIYFISHLNYILHTDMGYNTRNIVTATLSSEDGINNIRNEEEWEKMREEMRHKASLLTIRLNESPLITHWCNPQGMPYQMTAGSSNRNIIHNGQSIEVMGGNLTSSYQAIMGYELVAGRMFTDKDEWTAYICIINESMARLLGITDLAEAYVQPARRLWFTWSTDASVQEEMKTNPPYRVVGIIKDFKTGHPTSPTRPLFFTPDKDGFGRHPFAFYASYPEGRRADVVDFLVKLHAEVGNGELKYSFIEDELAAVFDDDRRTVHIYTTFSVVAIVISCLGLLGLSLFDIQRRRREIALRKVHGSTVSQIFGLLMKRYIIIMTTAFAVSIPLALWLINIYTADFASCAPIGIWIFLTVALLIGGISTGALYVQVRRAAHIPPAEAIAME
ncbi:MAG: ABC transporter permease [Bacteroidaceae bacterium]|nr:ABC transporter permease [Bacteroidaceae bacterium]